MVFFFTGTGNSLYIARQIEKDPVSIPQVMGRAAGGGDAPGASESGGRRMEFSADSIGVVAPVYGHELPAMVKEFLKRAVFHTDYFYLLLTYGNRHGGAAELAESFCAKCGISAQYINVVLMADNWLPGFDMEEQMKLDKRVEEQIEAILSDLRARKEGISSVTEQDRAAHREFLNRMSVLPGDAWQHLIQVTDRCTGCGICSKVCPSGSMRVEGGKAAHIPGNCQTCLACAHACPWKAVQLTVPEKNPEARYRNPHVSLQDLIAANGRAEKNH